MMGELAGIPLVGITAPTLVGIAVLMLMTGRIVPRSVLQDKKEESERWREAYEKEREARSAADAQSHELLEVSKTTHHIVEALFQNTQYNMNRGGTDVLPKA